MGNVELFTLNGAYCAQTTGTTAKVAFLEVKEVCPKLSGLTRYKIVNPNNALTQEDVEDLVLDKRYNMVKTRKSTCYCYVVTGGSFIFVWDEEDFNADADTFLEQLISHKKFHWGNGMQFTLPEDEDTVYTVGAVLKTGTSTRQIVGMVPKDRARVFLQHELTDCDILENEDTAHALRNYLKNVFEVDYALVRDKTSNQYLLIQHQQIVDRHKVPTELMAKVYLEVLNG